MLSRNDNQSRRQHLLANKMTLKAFAGNAFHFVPEKCSECIDRVAEDSVVQQGLSYCNLKFGRGRTRGLVKTL